MNHHVEIRADQQPEDQDIGLDDEVNILHGDILADDSKEIAPTRQRGSLGRCKQSLEREQREVSYRESQ